MWQGGEGGGGALKACTKRSKGTGMCNCILKSSSRRSCPLACARASFCTKMQAHYDMSAEFEAAINITNIVVTAIFVVEFAAK